MAAVRRWPPENTSRICATRSRSVRSTASGSSISTRTPFGIAARVPRPAAAPCRRACPRSCPRPAARRSGPRPRPGVPQRRFVQVVEADPQELLAGPVGEAVGQLGEPLGEPKRRGPARPCRPRRVTIPAWWRPMPARSSSSERSRGRRAAAQSPASAGMSVRATPLMCLRTGLVSVPNPGSCANWATASTAERTSRSARARSPAGGGEARPGRRRWPPPRRRRPRRTGRGPRPPDRSARPVQAADDVPEALRGRGDGVAFPLGVAREPGGAGARPRRPGGPARRARPAPGRPPGSSGTP